MIWKGFVEYWLNLIHRDLFAETSSYQDPILGKYLESEVALKSFHMTF